ncbi:MAG: rSAM/selenodomain-associated transferase 1 [Pseudohongiellaceae bacterium]|jgi:rSAM/selenodomain-associated transferase 1
MTLPMTPVIAEAMSEVTDYLFPNSRILVFAKAPVVGCVKTRLQPVLSPEQSCELHQQLLEHNLAMLKGAGVAPVTLLTAGEHPCWQLYHDGFNVQLESQIEGDLGERMAQAAVQALRGCDSVILMGSDCPFITKDYLGSAFKFLQQGVEVVFGPANDGGYVLLGLNQVPSALFTGVDWGTERVLQQSCQNLAPGYMCLPSLTDIDRPEDIRSLADLEAFKRWLCCVP